MCFLDSQNRFYSKRVINQNALGGEKKKKQSSRSDPDFTSGYFYFYSARHKNTNLLQSNAKILVLLDVDHVIHNQNFRQIDEKVYFI